MEHPPKQSPPGEDAVAVRERGTALLQVPRLNKGTAFTPEERVAFGLEGLLPDQVSGLELQVGRVHASLQRKHDPLEQYIGLVGLQDRNEVLFYRLLLEHVETYLPIVYTPTVGLATQRYSEIFRRPRGIWITPRHRGKVEEVLANAPFGEVRLIVVTDSERILGLGDQGAGGMGIPIGKLALYTVGAGIDPRVCLPVCLDVGTDNEELREKDVYLGYRHSRLRGPEYDELIEEFVQAVGALYPGALLQWEDFKKVNAMRILERYRKRVLSFNDDIQGTAAVALAGVLAGVRATGTSLADQRIVMLGAGAAGIGITDQLGRALGRAGLEESEIRRRIAVVDSRGVLIEGRTYREGEEYKRRYEWPRDHAASLGLAGESISLAEVVEALRPTVLIGVSGQPGVFTEDLVRAMAAGVERPLVFPFSNPTSRAEARPQDVIPWTDGRALVATGSPFEPVEYRGRTREIGQGNNVYVFPGVGLGALAGEAREITEEMFTAAAETLAAEVAAEEIERGLLYPSLRRLRAVSHAIARSVARQAIEQGVAPERTDEEIERRLADWTWNAEYRPFVPA